MGNGIDVNTLPNQTEADRAVILQSVNGIIWSVIGHASESLDADSIDDLHSCALESANRAIIDYDPAKGASIATLVVRYVTQARRDFMRKRGVGNGATHNKQSTFEYSASRLDDCGEGDDPECTDRTDAINVMEITIDMARNDGIIDEREYQILVMRRHGVIQREIGEQLGICPQRVHQIQGDAIRKIRKRYRTAE